jgi:hypothetical protein
MDSSPSSSTVWRVLAPELWIHIASEAQSNGDLNRLCRTSKYFLHLLRPILYRTIRLRNIRRHKPGGQRRPQYEQETLELLASNRDLARCVVDIWLWVQRHEDGWLPPYYMDAIWNMVSLKKLKVEGNCLPFRNVAEQKLFLENVSVRQPPLEGFAFIYWTLYCGDTMDFLEGEQGFPLSNIRNFEWDARLCMFGSPCVARTPFSYFSR